jgi:hypothetical protein
MQFSTKNICSKAGGLRPGSSDQSSVDHQHSASLRPQSTGSNSRWRHIEMQIQGSPLVIEVVFSGQSLWVSKHRMLLDAITPMKVLSCGRLRPGRAPGGPAQTATVVAIWAVRRILEAMSCHLALVMTQQVAIWACRRLRSSSLGRTRLSGDPLRRRRCDARVAILAGCHGGAS